jgi:hypothetical protein
MRVKSSRPAPVACAISLDRAGHAGPVQAQEADAGRPKKNADELYPD